MGPRLKPRTLSEPHRLRRGIALDGERGLLRATEQTCAALEASARRVALGLLGLLLSAFILPAPAVAQAPSEAWRTLETEHFRFHFPASAEQWTRRVAARMEAIRRRVAEEVGYSPTQQAEVIVRDPLARANGSAWPLLSGPRMILYTTPPAADSVLGNYRDWGELLAVHEDVHLVHLLRPSRNRTLRLVESLVPLGPISRAAPRWVTEGYATLLEGRLTGWGRPHSSLRAALLRRWAQAGELPRYGALSGDGRRWLGFSMPYLMGSAYLEWLEERAGPDALRHLWRRLSATQSRGFEAAFRGVFGDSPARLYHRFCAELTYRAMTLEREIEPRLEAGELWQDLARRPSAPTVDSPGDHLAMVLRRRGEPARLVVWSTAEDGEAAEKRRQLQAEILERDPQDVATVWPEVLPREPKFTLEARHGASPFAPRWSRSGEWILYHQFEVDSAGDRRSDLFRWWPRSGRVERLTCFADLRTADPSPDGVWAVALRHRWGRSQLVRVELASGRVEGITEASAERVYDQPRISPDGRHLAYLVQTGSGWRLTRRDLATGEEQRLPLRLGEDPASELNHPAWSADGREILISVGQAGFIDLFAVPANGGEPRRLTRTHGAALAPAPVPGGGAYFLSLESDGFDLRFLPPRPPASPTLRLAASLSKERRVDFVPVVPPEASEQIAGFEPTELGASSPYGVGPGAWLPLLGGAQTREGGRVEAGVRYGDLIGRLNVVALGAVADGGLEGGAIAGVWRGGWAELSGRLFSLERRGDGPLAGFERRGLELALAKHGAGRRLAWSWNAGVLAGELENGAGDHFDQRFAFAGAGARWRQSWGALTLHEQVGASVTLGETSGGGLDDGWNRGGLSVEFEADYDPVDGPGLGLALYWRRAHARSAGQLFDRLRLGGVDDSLTPRSVTAADFFSPALPTGFQFGENAEHQRVELGVGGGWGLFGERFRLWDEGRARGTFVRVAGLRFRFQSQAFPLLALPGLDVEAGAAVLFDPPFEDDVEGWLMVRWRP